MKDPMYTLPCEDEIRQAAMEAAWDADKYDDYDCEEEEPLGIVYKKRYYEEDNECPLCGRESCSGYCE